MTIAVQDANYPTSVGPVWSPVFHLHQPPYDNSTIRFYREAAERSYSHHLDVLDRHPDTKVTFNLTGSLLEQMMAYNPELVRRFRNGIDREQIQLTATGYSHPIFPIVLERIGEDAVRLQIQRDLQLKEKLFGVRPQTFRLPEHAVSDKIVDILGEYFDYILLCENAFDGAGLPDGYAVKRGRATLIKRNAVLSKFLSDDYLRNLWGGTAEYFSYRILEHGGVVTDLDGETFDHHLMLCDAKDSDKGLEWLYDAVADRGIQTVHIPEFSSRLLQIQSDATIPTTSYEGDLSTWQGWPEHETIWGDIIHTWNLYRQAKLDGYDSRIVREMEDNALNAMVSCFTWGVAKGYPDWFKQQPGKYATRNQELAQVAKPTKKSGQFMAQSMPT